MQVEGLKHALSPGYDLNVAQFEALSKANVPIRALLEGYSNIEPEKVLAHVKDVVCEAQFKGFGVFD